MSVTIREGSALDVLRTLPSESVQCVVTSPPYFGLRSYGTNPQVWGGDPGHEHTWGTVPSPGSRTSDTHPGPLQHAGNKNRERLTSDLCACGAWRGELGLEPTPSMFIDHLVTIFEEVRRVLRLDGLCFVNLGDSYHNARSGGMPGQTVHDGEQRSKPDEQPGHRRPMAGIPQKSLLLIPERFAIGMQERGWTVRSRIAWCKTSAMPESVRDRPTSAWEHVWMFSRSQRYFYDADAVRQPVSPNTVMGPKPFGNKNAAARGLTTLPGNMAPGMKYATDPSGANLRNYWLLGPEPSSLEHYAGFPTELPKRCILAGTSEKGACPACGAPWVRVVERTGRLVPSGPNQIAVKPKGQNRHAYDGPLSERGTDGYGDLPKYETVERGWSSSCSCDAGPPIPQRVLDPFLGSGTTALVADRLGRDAIGIELNPAYARMARDRIANDAPMVSEPVEVVATDQLGLFGEVAG